MSLYKLESSDGVIFTVDAATVQQMVTIQTMIDHEDEASDEVTPVPTVNAQFLEKIIQWTEYHKIYHEKTEETSWYIQYFNVELKKVFEIIIAADYLEVKSLLNESCRHVSINYKLEIIEDAASNFHDPKVLTLLEKYEKEHGNEVVVTIVDAKHMKYLDMKTETWTHLIDVPKEYLWYDSRMCWVEGNFYLVVGGEDRVVTKYNPRTNTWRNVQSLQQKRYGHSVCTLDQKIFVLGGLDNTCEMLDLSDDDPQWRYIAEMNSRHYLGGAVVVEKKIYVMGGKDTFNIVDVYHVDQDEWIGTLLPTHVAIYLNPGIAALNNKIYVTGGRYGAPTGGSQYISHAYCYDPDTNTWSQLPNMNIPRCGHGLVSLDGRIYAIGGKGDIIWRLGGYNVDSVEVYNADDNTWTILQQKLDGEVAYTGTVLINKYHAE